MLARVESWDPAAAYQRAEAQLAALSPTPPAPIEEQEPVSRARRLNERFAEMDARLLIALRHGTDPEVLERLKASSRLIADLCRGALASVGIKSGEALSLEPSARMEAFLARWNDGGRDLPVAEVLDAEVIPRRALPATDEDGHR